MRRSGQAVHRPPAPDPRSPTWLLWQLADSSFPVGGFAHSAGLEAALHAGEIQNDDALRGFVIDALWQAGHGALPLVNFAFDRPQAWPEFDVLCDAFLSNHVANRASRTQGRAFLSTCERSFSVPEVVKLKATAKRCHLNLHYAPVFGVVLKALGISKEQAQQLFMFLALRGILSAAVRLNIVGPLNGQAIQGECAPEIDKVLERCASLDAPQLAQTAPLIDLFQAAHDRLYSRLFQS